MANRNTKIRGVQIHDNTIDESKLIILNNPVDGYFLKWNSVEGKFEWVSGIGALTETPSGLINGSNKVFVLNYAPSSGTLALYLNGLYQEEGSAKDYVIVGSSITFVDAPQVGDIIIASYHSASIAGGGGASALTDLTDVQMDSGTPLDKQVLTYDSVSSKWKAETPVQSYKDTFENGDLSANKITITHNLNIEHPMVIVYDNNDNMIQPSEITYKTVNSIELDFTDMTPLTGTYKVRIMG